MSDPRILNAAVVARIRSLPLKSPYDYKGELIGHIDALTKERDQLRGALRRQVCNGHRKAVACNGVWDREVCLSADCWLTVEEREALGEMVTDG
jgi:hypothetical protein